MNWQYSEGIPGLPWSQYNVISVEAAFTVEDSIEFLSQCVSATSVVLRGWRNPEYCSTFFDRPRIVLPHLTTLTLDKSTDPLRILSCLTLPSLQHLQVDIFHRDFQVLDNFLQRSKCQLKDLLVIDLSIQEKEIATFFSFPWMKTIPNVKLGPTYENSIMLGFLQRFEEAGLVFPDLMVWNEGTIGIPLLLGWKESGHRGTYYSYEGGKIIAPLVSKRL